MQLDRFTIKSQEALQTLDREVPGRPRCLTNPKLRRGALGLGFAASG